MKKKERDEGFLTVQMRLEDNPVYGGAVRKIL